MNHKSHHSKMGWAKVGWSVGLATMLSAGLHAQQVQRDPILLSDFQCRGLLTESFNALRVSVDANIDAYGLFFRLVSTESFRGRNTNYEGFLKVYDRLGLNQPGTEVLRGELTMWKDGVLQQRIAADGRRVWAYDPRRSEYSVTQYDAEASQNQSPRYRRDFLSQLKSPTQGISVHLINLAEQVGVSGMASARDWIGGLPFQGQDRVDPEDSTEQHWFRNIWQSTPDRSRFVQFNMESWNNRASWVLTSIQIYRQERIGNGNKTTNTFLYQQRSADGIPMGLLPNSADFFFRPPAGSKVLANPRTIKF